MNRRDLFRTIAAAGVAGIAGFGRRADADDDTSCVLTPQQTAGPFYFNAKQVRKNITEDRPGVPLLLGLTVMNVKTCEPIPDALVDIWHTDAAGIYSGYARGGDATGDDFMRGIQVTDKDGRVEFETVYPGWYRGRVTHIHFKVHLDDRTMVTSQLYFPDKITTEVYARPPYNTRGQNPTTNERDGVMRRGDLDSLLMKVVKDDEDAKGYIASHTIGVA